MVGERDLRGEMENLATGASKNVVSDLTVTLDNDTFLAGKRRLLEQ